MKCFGLLVSAIIFAIASEIRSENEWWERAAIYQIYPRSLKDSDGDGIGDLRGIADKLEYLKGLGFNAILVNSVFQSSTVDYGYDITDFMRVHSDYGTNADLIDLIYKAKEKDMKVILEIVPNHSSIDHEWFKKSAKAEDKYKNYYVWHPGRGNSVPPSNWQSIDENESGLGSAWTYSSERGEYYYHKFNKNQPDLNYRDSNVLAEFYNILSGWLDRGVFGFYINSASYIFETAAGVDGRLPDEEPSGTTNDTTNPNYLIHSHTQDLDETFELLYRVREFIDEYSQRRGETRILLTESYSNLFLMHRFYKKAERKGAHLPMNFELVKHLRKDSNAKQIVKLIEAVMEAVPEKHVISWSLGNLDTSRTASRLGKEKILHYNALIALLPGTLLTYYGEEIGMTNVCVDFDEVTGIFYVCQTGESSFSKDDARTPMQWDDSLYSGFSNASTWLPIAENYKEKNVKLQENVETSHLENFRQLLSMRKFAAVQSSELKLDTLSDNVLMIRRELNESRENVIAFLNFGRFYTHMGDFDLNSRENFKVGNVTIKMTKGNSLYSVDEVVPLEEFKFVPFDVVVGVYASASSLLAVNLLLTILAASLCMILYQNRHFYQ